MTTQPERWALTELCAGTAALSYHLLGARALVPMQGSKWRFAGNIEAEIRARGFEGAPTRIDLVDPGPWGVTHGALSMNIERVIESVEFLNKSHPKEIYDMLNSSYVPALRHQYAAEHLFLQRIAFSGIAVQEVDGAWKPAGYNTSSAEGKAKTPPKPATETKPATKGFGKINPMVPNLIRRLKAVAVAKLPHMISYHQTADQYIKEVDRINEVILIDPPYKGTAGYGHKFAREEVIQTARDLSIRGAMVIVCEAEPIPELIAMGFSVVNITKSTGNSRFRGRHGGEFLTISPPHG